MDRIAAYRGIPPSKIIARFLKSRGVTQREIAAQTHIHFQTLNAIISGKRDLTIEQSLRLDKALEFDPGTLAILQTYYKINLVHKHIRLELPPPAIRPCVFWDIDPSKLDWSANRDFILQRITERGTPDEIAQTLKYYAADPKCLLQKDWDLIKLDIIDEVEKYAG